MGFPKLLLTACAVLISYLSFSQAICGFDQVHGQKMKTDPIYRNTILNAESNLRKYIREHNVTKSFKAPTILSGPPYTIPVVVHVVSTGGAIGTTYNPSDQQIQGAINYLNQVYNGTYPGISGAGDLGIQFVLAQRDPNCNPTNGIVRLDGSSLTSYSDYGISISGGPGEAELNVKNLSRWDPTQYYNIWLVNKLDGNDGTSGTFIAGYAYFPGTPSNLDGTVMLATQMVAGQKTLPHEIGHAFNLYHTFEGSADRTICPANADCTVDGDQVCDTDPISYNQLGGLIDFSCRTGTNTCTGTPYSNNTEHNFMNYTNCYDLFTTGQKLRMQASAAGAYRLSLTNSTGSLAPDQSPACAPKIDFEISGDRLTETTGSASGCRNYKDYTYQMVIGAAPTATATVTLQVHSLTATEGLDFDVTTNGNFAAASKTLIFPAGSTASQSFTLRIYDDASVESTENFTMDFSVDPGTGNALAGDGRPVFSMTIDDNDIAPTNGVLPSGTANVGTATTTASAGPFDATQQSQKVQFQYKASELTAAGIPSGYISSLALFIQSKLSTRAFTGFTIKLGKSGASYLINGVVTTGSSMTVVKTFSSYTTLAGWNNFVFDTPYLWDGTSNLVVECCFDNGSVSAGAGADQVAAYFDGGSASQGNMFLQNGINCSQLFSSVSYYPSGRKPIAKWTYGVPQTAVDTVLNTSKQEYLGPNSDVYFYDQANNLLMGRIQNTGNFDYGCTQLIIDRAGSSATPFWNNTPANYLMDKTFRVLPTTNNPSGAYTITLYFTQTEINGWQAVTGQNINSIQLAKTSNSISLVTPSNPTGAGTVIMGTPAISNLGTNTGLTASFTTGFSGFGAGVVNTVLPITLLNLEGQIVNGHSEIHWTTSSESNSKGFDIERSSDGSHFEKIGYAPAAGNSSVESRYSFRDPGPAATKNYYRLKMIDRDEQFQYSKVILLTDPGTSNFFHVLNNPFTQSIDILLDQPAAGGEKIRLLDITGKELCSSGKAARGQTRMHMDLSALNLSAGIYLLEGFLRNQRHVERVIKQ